MANIKFTVEAHRETGPQDPYDIEYLHTTFVSPVLPRIGKELKISNSLEAVKVTSICHRLLTLEPYIAVKVTLPNRQWERLADDNRWLLEQIEL